MHDTFTLGQVALISLALSPSLVLFLYLVVAIREAARWEERARAQVERADG